MEHAAQRIDEQRRTEPPTAVTPSDPEAPEQGDRDRIGRQARFMALSGIHAGAFARSWPYLMTGDAAVRTSPVWRACKGIDFSLGVSFRPFSQSSPVDDSIAH